MIYNKPLDQLQTEEANRFRIGQKVKINEFSRKDWIGDWLRTEATVQGVWIDQYGKVSYCLLHDGDQVTDGFEADDLRPVSIREGVEPV